MAREHFVTAFNETFGETKAAVVLTADAETPLGNLVIDMQPDGGVAIASEDGKTIVRLVPFGAGTRMQVQTALRTADNEVIGFDDLNRGLSSISLHGYEMEQRLKVESALWDVQTLLRQLRFKRSDGCYKIAA